MTATSPTPPPPPHSPRKPDSAPAARPSPGPPPAGRPGRYRRWHAGLRGWPDALPLDLPLEARAMFELQRTSVKTELARRSRGALATSGSALGLGVLCLFVYSGARFGAEQLLGSTVLAGMIAFIVAAPLAAWSILRVTRLVHAPRLRAALRREGIDCCIRCGFLMARGEPADTCPECGREHRDFPLGWGPGPIAATTSNAGGDRPPSAENGRR